MQEAEHVPVLEVVGVRTVETVGEGVKGWLHEPDMVKVLRVGRVAEGVADGVSLRENDGELAEAETDLDGGVPVPEYVSLGDRTRDSVVVGDGLR